MIKQSWQMWLNYGSRDGKKSLCVIWGLHKDSYKWKKEAGESDSWQICNNTSIVVQLLGLQLEGDPESPKLPDDDNMEGSRFFFQAYRKTWSSANLDVSPLSPDYWHPWCKNNKVAASEVLISWKFVTEK